MASQSARSVVAGALRHLCFGGARRNRLFMAASHSLYSLYTNAQGWR
jgi:hypothetical protein